MFYNLPAQIRINREATAFVIFPLSLCLVVKFSTRFELIHSLDFRLMHEGKFKSFQQPINKRLYIAFIVLIYQSSFHEKKKSCGTDKENILRTQRIKYYLISNCLGTFWRMTVMNLVPALEFQKKLFGILNEVFIFGHLASSSAVLPLALATKHDLYSESLLTTNEGLQVKMY